MANDCLVTKLKGVVQNDNLVKLGSIRFVIPKSSRDMYFSLMANQTSYSEPQSVITILDEGKVFPLLGRNYYNIPWEISGGCVPPHEGCTVEISNKYNLTMCMMETSLLMDQRDTAYDIDIKELNCLTALTKVGLPVSGDLNDWVPADPTIITDINMVSGNITGNISSYSRFVNLSNLAFTQAGEISALGSLVNLLRIWNISPNFAGSLESFAESQIANGRTSGSVEVIGGGGLTYQGNVIPFAVNKTITFSNGSYTVS